MPDALETQFPNRNSLTNMDQNKEVNKKVETSAQRFIVKHCTEKCIFLYLLTYLIMMTDWAVDTTDLWSVLIYLLNINIDIAIFCQYHMDMNNRYRSTTTANCRYRC